MMVIEDNKLRETVEEMARRFSAEKDQLQKKVKDILEGGPTLSARIKSAGESELSAFKQDLEHRSKQWNSTQDQIVKLREHCSRLESENNALKAEIVEMKSSRRAEEEDQERKRQRELANAAELSEGDLKKVMHMLDEERRKWREKFHPRQDETIERREGGE